MYRITASYSLYLYCIIRCLEKCNYRGTTRCVSPLYVDLFGVSEKLPVGPAENTGTMYRVYLHRVIRIENVVFSIKLKLLIRSIFASPVYVICYLATPQLRGYNP